ncbi:hypothetical protein L9F63_009925, partial [Diploptera punctata]
MDKGPTKEPISVRITRLNRLFLGRNGNAVSRKHYLGREGLLDALTVLFDECNNDVLKKDRNIAAFVEKFYTIVSEIRSLRVNITDFEVKQVIGRGHFGEVQVVREKHSGHVYAMKTIRKSDTLHEQTAAFYEEERDIMAHANSPWLTQLQYAFQDKHSLYLVMEFHPGGDLLSLLDRFSGILEEDMARFYLAELVLAIRSLHNMGYVHRDIKPDNILIDMCGHLKLADFGSAAKLTPCGFVMSQMPVGTPEYIAPEVLQSMEAHLGNKKDIGCYGVECDYWSLGIVAYEMVLGFTPFSGDQLTMTYNNIMNHQTSLNFSEDCTASQLYRDLVSGLLKEASTRLRHEQLIKHPFFASINWNTLRETVPPFIPIVNGEDDTSNFDEFNPEPQTPSIESFKTKKGFSGDNLPFVGFTYVQEMETNESKATNGSSPEITRGLGDTVAKQKKEIEDLQKKLHNMGQEHERRIKEIDNKEKKFDMQKQQLEIVTAVRDSLEQKCEQLKNEHANLLRAMEQEQNNRKADELKKINMIRETKVKWELKHRQQIQDLEKQIESHVQKITDLCTTNNMLICKVDIQEEELKSAHSEIKLLQALVKENKETMAKSRENNRRSIVGVESKLEQITAVNQNQVAVIKSQLIVQTKLHSELQQQLLKMESDMAEKDAEISSLKEKESSEIIRLTSELESYHRQTAVLQQQVKELTEQTNIAAKNQEATTKILIKELEEKLRREKQECSNLRTKIVDLEGELSESLMSRESIVSARDSEREAHVATLEKELKEASGEKMKLVLRLQEAKDKEEEDSHKLETLEGLLERLEQGLKRLEEENEKLKGEKNNEVDNTDKSILVKELENQKAILVAQVEKLEAQVEKVREVSILDKHVAKTTQDKLWKKEKELADAKIDLRIAQREAKTAEEQVKTLQKEKEKWVEKLQTEKNANADQLQAERNKLDALHDQVTALQNELKEMRQKEENARKQVEVEKCLFAEKIKELESTRNSAQNLQCDLTSANKQVKILEQKVTSVQTELKQLYETMNDLKDEKLKLQSELEEEKSKHSSLELNYNVLKDVCEMNDAQLEHYENVIESHKEMDVAHSNEKKTLQTQLGLVQAELKTASQSTNEEKSLRMRAESRIRTLESDLQTRIDEISVLQAQVDNYHTTVEDRTQQVAELEDQCCTRELELRNCQRQLQSCKDECQALKEELTQHITQLSSVKETNFQLNRDLEDANEQIQQLNFRFSDLEASLVELEADFKQREYKSDATIKQQMKLIDHLRREIQESSKKKKTLTDKLFGSKQKENIALLGNTPSITARNVPYSSYKQASRVKSFSENKALQQSVSTGSDKKSSVTAHTPVTPLSKKALTHLVQSPGTQTPNSFARQPTLQRMHYNIPHRFEQKVCMRTAKCAACQDSIHFGQYASTCQECGSSAHPKCSLILPSTCGLPKGLARHFSKSWNSSQVERSSSTNDSESDDFSQGSSKMEGFVKIPKRGRSYWERKFMRLEGNELQIFDHELTSENMSPIQTFLVCRPEGTTSIMSSVPYAEVGNTAKSDLPFIFKIEISPRTTCWPGTSQLIMALSLPEKQTWMSALESLVRSHNSSVDGQPVKYRGKTILQLDKTNGLDLNCCLQLSPHILLLGAEEGLYSLRLQEKNAKPVKMNGFSHVHQMSTLPIINCLLILAGEEPTLIHCDLRQARINAEALECVHPSITGKAILPSCLTYAAATTQDRQEQPRTIICAASEKKVV